MPVSTVKTISKLSIAVSAVAMLLIPAAVSAHSSSSVTCGLAITPLQFGEYLPYLGAASDFTATLTLTCTTSGAASELWDGSIALVGTRRPGARELKNGPQLLIYRLYLDPARTLPWGDRSGEGTVLPVSGAVGPAAPYRQTIVIYGRVSALQTSAMAGQYADHVTAFLDY